MKEEMTFSRDPVCKMQVNPQQAGASLVHMGQTFFFCTTSCAQEFEKNPHRYMLTAHAHHEGCKGQGWEKRGWIGILLYLTPLLSALVRRV